MKNNINANYVIIPSVNPKFKEVMVTYSVNGGSHRHFIFLPINKKLKDKDYINQAKKQFEADYKTGKIKAPKAVKSSSSKTGLIIATSILGVATLALGGLFTWKLLTGGNGGGGGGDEPIPWVDSNKESVFEVRDNILNSHTDVNPLNFLKEKLGGTQFEVTYRSEVLGLGGVNAGKEIRTTTYRIDIDDKLYIERIDDGGSKNKSAPMYLTFHEDGVYYIEGTPTKLYDSTSLEDAVSKFKNSTESPEGKLQTFIYEILGTRLYAKKSKINESTSIFATSLEDVIGNYQAIQLHAGEDEIIEADEPKPTINMNYYTYGDSSFKIENTYKNVQTTMTIGLKTNFGEDMVLDAKCQGIFSYVIDNSLMAEYHAITAVDLTFESITQSAMDCLSFITKKPDVPFVPANLESYFSGK